MENPEILTPEDKLRIRAEETYRHEIKYSLERGSGKLSSGQKLWGFLNSTLGIWFLSTCLVGAITFFYSEYQTKKAKEEEAKQFKIEHARHNASMIIVLLPYLASQDEKQWQLAIEITKYLKLNGELPGELESALVGIVRSADTAKTSVSQQAKINAAASVIDIPGDAVQGKTTGLASLPARVYVHISNDRQKQLAKQLEVRLRAENFITPGIENVAGKASIPNEAEVRYYRTEEKEEAIKIVAILKTIGAGFKVKDTPQRIPGTGRGTRPRHYEIWFPK